MKLTKLLYTTILLPLLCIQASAQDLVTPPPQSKLLSKGNTWHYKATLAIPEGVQIPDNLKGKGTRTPHSTVFTFKERQESLGEGQIEELELKATSVNIYIDDKLKKRQLLKSENGILLYFGTFDINEEKPDEKAGFITKAAIPLHGSKTQAAEKWEWKHDTLGTIRFRMIAKNTDVSVEAGEFKADKIKMEQLDKRNKVLLSKEIWFVPNVGIVKETEKQFIPSGKAIQKVLELTKYTKASTSK